MPPFVRSFSWRATLLLGALAAGPVPDARAEAPPPIVRKESAAPGTPEQAAEREQERLVRRFHLRVRHGVRWEGSPPAAARSSAPQPAPRPSLQEESTANQILAAPLR